MTEKDKQKLREQVYAFLDSPEWYNAEGHSGDVDALTVFIDRLLAEAHANAELRVLEARVDTVNRLHSLYRPMGCGCKHEPSCFIGIEKARLETQIAALREEVSGGGK